MELLKPKAAAKYLAMSATKLRELAHKGKIAYVSMGENTSDFRFRVTDLDAFVERSRIPATSEVSSSDWRRLSISVILRTQGEEAWPRGHKGREAFTFGAACGTAKYVEMAYASCGSSQAKPTSGWLKTI